LDILLADGDEAYLSALEAMILHDCASDHQLHIARVTEVGQAVTQLTGNAFDVCFLDTRFATGTGFDILRAVERLDLRTAFIFLTTQDDRATAYAALSLGAMDYLIKAKLDTFSLVKSLAYALFRKSKEMELRGAAQHDSLTGLGNRVLFREQAGKFLQHAKRAREMAAVVFMDVDGLKPVNDTYGHQVGDHVLKQIAGRLLERARRSDIVARVGGDEFMALLGHVESPQIVVRVVEEIRNAISQNVFRVGRHAVWVGLSCGTALFPADSENIDDLIGLADKRMYEAKFRNKQTRTAAQMIWPR
jgi:diguanylate cyclase (GGDEF)-like protein